MTNPTRNDSYREIRSSKSYEISPVGDLQDLEKQVVEEHVGSGWVQEKGTEEELVFSTLVADGKKWTRHYNRKTCQFLCQRMYEIENVVKYLDWPPVHFGD